MSNNQKPTGTSDFEFFYGQWRVHNRRLRKRLQGSNDWETFEASQWTVPLMGGLGNMDEMSSETHGVIGMTFRFFNLVTKEWSLYWVGGNDGILQPPVVGTFNNGVGIFEGSDIFNGKPIIVRFIWSDTNTSTPRWEQEFSDDGGKTWEKNWFMTFERIGDVTLPFNPVKL